MSEKFALTIARQYGSGGFFIGKKLAENLQASFYDKELLRIAAKKSGFQENFIHDIDEKPRISLLFGNIAEQVSSTLGFDTCTENTSYALFRIQADIIKGLVRKDSSVFVGRAADYVLREHRHLISVFISADMEDRIKRISEERNITLDEARSCAETIDKQRARYYQYYTGKEWGVPGSYHLCINSSRLGLARTADFIQNFIGMLGYLDKT